VRPVNLLPARYRPARPTGERPGLGYIALVALAAVLIMVLVYVETVNGINDAKDKTADAQAQATAAQSKVGQLQGYGTFASLKQSRELAVAGVSESRVDYERVMREIALVLPHNTYLTSFSSTQSGSSSTSTSSTTTTTPSSTAGTSTSASAPATGNGPTITLAGCAPRHKDVATAIVRLRKMHNVNDVELTNSTRSTNATTAGGAACPTTWTATVTMHSETAPTASNVPARLGGGQ
jgi:hypothetical protein